MLNLPLFENTPNHLLPSGALFRLKHLQESGYVFSFNEDKLTDQQAKLLAYEEIAPGDFKAEQADGVIKKK